MVRDIYREDEAHTAKPLKVGNYLKRQIYKEGISHGVGGVGMMRHYQNLYIKCPVFYSWKHFFPKNF